MNEGWGDILQPGEHVLWQGQPDPSPRLTKPQLPAMLFGLMFSGFAVFWITTAMRAGSIWIFGLVHFFAGLVMAFGPIFIGPFMATCTWYSLTNRRAFFATRMPFSRPVLNVLDLRPSLGVDFDGDAPGTIRFRGRAEALVGDRFDSAPSFSKLHDARDVFKLIRDIQRGKA